MFIFGWRTNLNISLSTQVITLTYNVGVIFQKFRSLMHIGYVIEIFPRKQMGNKLFSK